MTFMPTHPSLGAVTALALNLNEEHQAIQIAAGYSNGEVQFYSLSLDHLVQTIQSHPVSGSLETEISENHLKPLLIKEFLKSLEKREP
jgi:hypothetical protein